VFDDLFSPLMLGKVTLPNRICFLGHRTNFAKTGRLDEQHVAYYRRRAQGRCGLIIVGEFSIDPTDRPWEAMIEVYGPHAVKDFRKLTRAVHEFDTAVFAQLNHHGFQSSGAISRQCIWGPSAISDIAFGETAKAMEAEDMAVLVEAFAHSAVLAREGGFDGLELDMGPESILRQFLSPLSNHRQDEYGGRLENRMCLPMEVLSSVRKAVGKDFPVGIRLCGDEKFWGAITTADSREMARAFEGPDRADFINVAVGTYYNLHLRMPSMYTPFGFSIETAAQIKAGVTVPVIASHQIHTPRMAEEILRMGQGDAIGLIRNLICDPDWPRKAQEGRLEEIRTCVRDNQGCIGRVNQSKTLGCIQNPEVGYEQCGMHNAECETKHADQSAGSTRKPKMKKVLVVGAGPAGLEAARAARERRHDVTLYEKLQKVGGQINLASKGTGREGILEVVFYLTRLLQKMDVPIITGKEISAAFIEKEQPDAVIIATGSAPRKRPVAANFGPPSVLNVWEVLEGRFPVGEKVLFVDEHGGHHATATVELLAEQGKKVDMVTSDLFIGIELAPIGDLYLTRQRLLQKDVTFVTDLMVVEIQGNKLMARNIYTNEPVVYAGYDTIVLDMGNQVEDRLYRELKGRVRELYRVGDCVAPRGIGMAIFEGRKVGKRL
jgi:mycofactocin system FadH/OYE family oxidoreductase 2